MKKHQTFFINTMGCQMNVYDTGQIEAILRSMGYQKTDTYASADLIIANTCAIREKAEQKAFSFLGRLAKLKAKNPRLIVGIGGCVAQQEGRRILDRVPHVDMVFGTDAISRLPRIIEQIQFKRTRIVDIETTPAVSEAAHGNLPDLKAVSQFVTIMQGCDNYCTYCVVPYVRGREKSRHPEHIINEIQTLVENGVREVTLLGQNVNSYGQKEGLCSFAELLDRINRIEGLLRIRFTTSHPKDLSPDLIAAFACLEKLCRHLHLPVQSGSTTLLKRMNRGYTRSQYMEKVQQLRDTGKDIAISTDIIVGFPGETEEDFADTLELIKEVEYDSLFVFNYSDRPNAPASHFGNKIPATIQNDRLQAVLDLQEKITHKKHEDLVGRTVDVLVEGMSKKHNRGNDEKVGSVFQWSGRTSPNKIVNFETDPLDSPDAQIYGEIVNVEIKKALAHSLWGKMAASPKSIGLKGEKHHAA